MRWLRLAWRLINTAGRDNLGIVAAGVAHYALLSIFPAIAALISIYGLVATPVTAEQQLRGVADVLPTAVYQILFTQMRAVAATSEAALSLGVIGGFLLALWSASRGTKALITALNIAYHCPEQRRLLRRQVIALLITLGGLLGGALVLVLVAIVPVIMSLLDLPPRFGFAVQLVRWSLLTLLIALAIGVLYRFAPSARLVGVPKHFGLTPGAILAALLWLLASAGLSWYAGHFGNYNKAYGSVGAAVVLLLWFSISAYAVLLGAELDAELARRNRE